MEKNCAGFAWGRILFTVSSMQLCFWIHAGFLTAKQGLHRAEAFSPFHLATLANRLGGNTARTGDTHLPKEYSTT